MRRGRGSDWRLVPPAGVYVDCDDGFSFGAPPSGVVYGQRDLFGEVVALKECNESIVTCGLPLVAVKRDFRVWR